MQFKYRQTHNKHVQIIRKKKEVVAAFFFLRHFYTVKKKETQGNSVVGITVAFIQQAIMSL